MEPWNDERVRPVRIEQDTPQSRTPRRTRPWVPLLVLAGALVLVLGVVAVFGALEFASDPDPDPSAFSSRPSGSSDTTTPDATSMTVPATLEDSVPGLSDRLTLVARTGAGLVTLLWDPSFRVPREYDLGIDAAGRSGDLFALFDSAGRSLAVGGDSPLGYGVFLGEPTDVGDVPDLLIEAPPVWHATEVGALAWVTVGDDGHVELHTGSVNPLTGTLMDDTVITDLAKLARLVRWDAAGFILDEGDQLAALDPSGSVVWRREGSARAATPSLVVVADPTPVGTLRWSILSRVDGEPTDPDLSEAPDRLEVMASRDLDIVAAVAYTPARSTLTVTGPDLTLRRIVQVDADVTPVGFSSDNSYFIFRPVGSNDLVFVNWRSGATYPLDIPDVYDVIALDLG